MWTELDRLKHLIKNYMSEKKLNFYYDDLLYFLLNN